MLDLSLVLREHELWLEDSTQGERASLHHEDLCGANLRGVDLSYSNLSGANLIGANLSGANLRYADLSGANLSGANLSCVNLRGANLVGANLSGTNLRYADLRGADFNRADLGGADIASTSGIISATLGCHLAVAYKCREVLHITIGCKTKTAIDWVENFEITGKVNFYTDTQIKLYGSFIKFVSNLPNTVWL